MAGSSQRLRFRIVAWKTLCLLATVTMLALAAEHFQSADQGGPLSGLCQLGSGWSCEETLAHPSAIFLSLPVPLWAVACYSLLFFIGPGAWASPRRRWQAGGMLTAMVLTTLYFLVIMERDFSKACPLCLAAHSCHLLLLLLFLSTPKLSPLTSEPAPPHGPPRLPYVPALLFLLASALFTGVWHEQEGVKAKARYLVSTDLLHTVLACDFDRFFPALPQQRIYGPAQARFQLVVIGSLSCPHCRTLLRSVARLPAALGDEVSISFIPYPLAPACNSLLTALPGRDPGGKHCLLAAETLAAQRQGTFWQLFARVEAAPGRLLRRLQASAADTPLRPWDPTLVRQIDTLAAIEVKTIPTLLWQGQRLPAALGSLPLTTLIPHLLDMDRAQPVGGSQDCGC